MFLVNGAVLYAALFYLKVPTDQKKEPRRASAFFSPLALNKTNNNNKKDTKRKKHAAQNDFKNSLV